MNLTTFKRKLKRKIEIAEKEWNEAIEKNEEETRQEYLKGRYHSLLNLSYELFGVEE